MKVFRIKSIIILITTLIIGGCNTIPGSNKKETKYGPIPETFKKQILRKTETEFESFQRNNPDIKIDTILPGISLGGTQKEIHYDTSTVVPITMLALDTIAGQSLVFPSLWLFTTRPNHVPEMIEDEKVKIVAWMPQSEKINKAKATEKFYRILEDSIYNNDTLHKNLYFENITRTESTLSISKVKENKALSNNTYCESKGHCYAKIEIKGEMQITTAPKELGGYPAYHWSFDSNTYARLNIFNLFDDWSYIDYYTRVSKTLPSWVYFIITKGPVISQEILIINQGKISKPAYLQAQIKKQ